MRLPSVPSRAVANHVNTTYFHKVWNAPNANARVNFALTKANARIKTGSVPVGLSVVGLPTTDAVYAVYQVPISVIDRYIPIPSEQWITDQTLLAQEGFSLEIYNAGGRMCPVGKTHLYAIPHRGLVLIAISVVYTQGCIGELFPALYGTLYRDTTRSRPLVTAVYTVSTTVGSTSTPSTVNTAITAQSSLCPNGTIVRVNGWLYDPAHVPTLVHGDVVVVSSDPDVVGYCDITVDDNMTGYHSERYNGYREVLHIPKSLNPNNIILTHDTLTAVVFDPETHRGVLGHRVDENALESITHNDFSMGRTALNAFTQSLGATSVVVRLYVRFPDSPNYLHEDVNAIHDLYSLNDETILNQLIGVASPQLPEWRASNLEQSGFLNLLYDFDGSAPDELIPTYVDAMGYYNLAGVLGQQMRYYTYRGAQVSITKPARLFGYQCTVLVYCNGVKLPAAMVAMSGDTTQSFLLGFPSNSGVQIGDEIAVYIAEAGRRTPIAYAPTSETPGITLTSDDYTLVLIKPYTTPFPVWNGTVNKGYSEITLNTADYTVTANSDGTFTFRVRSKHYGKNFYLIPKYGVATLGYDLYGPLTAKRPLIFSLTARNADNVLIPLMGYSALEVYINGLRLVENIDYTVSPILAEDGTLAQKVLTISNCDYLKLGVDGNHIEVVAHGDEVVSQDIGYVIDGTVYRSAQTPIFAPSSSRAFVNGVLRKSITESGQVLTVENNPTQGGVFLMTYNLAYGAKKLMASQSPNEDISLRGRVEAVLGMVAPTYPEVVVLDHQHSLYSPFLAMIVSDVASGLLVLVDEPTVERFYKQLEDYAWLLPKDPTIGANNPLIDRRFVTLAAHYANFTVTNDTQMQLVQRLIALVLTPSELTIEEVLL